MQLESTGTERIRPDQRVLSTLHRHVDHGVGLSIWAGPMHGSPYGRRRPLLTLHGTLPTNIPAGLVLRRMDHRSGEPMPGSRRGNNTALQEHAAAEGRQCLPVHRLRGRPCQGPTTARTWENALTSLQDALAMAMPGREIHVAAGVYTPDQGLGITRGDREASFMLRRGVTILGGYAGAGATESGCPRYHDLRDHPQRRPERRRSAGRGSLQPLERGLADRQQPARPYSPRRRRGEQSWTGYRWSAAMPSAPLPRRLPTTCREPG